MAIRIPPMRILPNGYDPTLNQSEHGIPMLSRYGQTLRANIVPMTGIRTLLPGPYHFVSQVGAVVMGTYSIVPVINPMTANMTYANVPLNMQPRPDRPLPWRR